MLKRATHPVTIVWELCAGDCHSTRTKLAVPLAEATVEALLDALCEGTDTPREDVRFLATFEGHHTSLWGAAVQE